MGVLDDFIQMSWQFKQEKCNQGRPRMSTAGRLLAHPVIDRFFITPNLFETRLLRTYTSLAYSKYFFVRIINFY